MKAGDRVELTESMEELIAGTKGTVVTFTEQFPFVPIGVETMPVLGVRFDKDKYTQVARTINGKYTTILSKCKLI